MNLGIDFGSTYTIVSIYDENNKLLEALLLGGMTSPCIPTVAALKKDKLSFGVTAKNATGQIKTSMFNGFKMLISENDQDELARRGFDQEYTPVRLTNEFLENIVQMAEAFKLAINAGRQAYLSGLGRVMEKGASASSPLTGFLR